MGRRELREELQASWSTYEAREPGRPFRKKDIIDADELASGERTAPSTSCTGLMPSSLLPLSLIARGAR